MGISAGARKVDLTFHWRESDCYIVVRDNGCGMSAAELMLRCGWGQNPLTKRPGHDLGRFGLGLKTASFRNVVA